MNILELKKLSKSFNGTKAVNGVSIGFEKGRVTGLIGPNGAGKTTLFHLINGFLKPDEGQIFYRGSRIDGLKPWQVAKLGIGRLFQDVRVFGRMTALDNILAAFPHQLGENPFAAIFKSRKIAKAEAEIKEKAFHWLKFVGLSGCEGRFAEDLSYGQQKLLSIARLLALGSETLLLDEPVSGISPQMLRPLLSLIGRLAEEEKRAVVVIEHNMGVISEVSNWIYFMAEGKIILSGQPSDVLANPEVRKVYIGY